MTTSLDPKIAASINNYDPEQRLKYLLKEVHANQQIWILTDEDGCVMLNSEDEDCAPVWPNREFAEAWATGEWENCQAKAIDLKVWFSRWTQGLENDEVAVAIFPNQDEEGLVISPRELDFELKQQGKK